MFCFIALNDKQATLAAILNYFLCNVLALFEDKQTFRLFTFEPICFYLFHKNENKR